MSKNHLTYLLGLIPRMNIRYLIFFFIGLLCSVGVLAKASKGCRNFDVFYGGFAIAGDFEDFKALYPFITNLSEQRDEKGHNAFQEMFREVFKEAENSAVNFTLQFAKADDEIDHQKIFAFVFTDERVSVEKVGGLYKCCVNLGADLLVLDFESMKVVGCEPIIWEIIETFETPPKNKDICDFLIRFMNSEKDFKKPLLGAFSRLNIQDFSRASVGVTAVTIEDDAISFLSVSQRTHLDGYKRWIANQYKTFLSSELNLAVLPYGEKGGAVTIKMAGRFKNTDRINFKIVPPSYGIELSLIRFKKVLKKETASERLLIYGAYMRFRIKNSASGFDEIIKKGLPKIVPKSMSVEDIDDLSAYQETLKNLFLKSTKIMTGNKKFRKEVLKKCERK